MKNDNLSLKFLGNSRPKEVLDYYQRNFDHLKLSMPIKEKEFYTINYWKDEIKKQDDYRKKNKALKYVIEDSDSKVLGCINFDGFMFGCFDACYVGYSIDKEIEGKGIMTFFLKKSMNYVVNDLGITRIMANFMPVNKRSWSVLKKCGFEKEGYANSYLKINGKWEDHVLSSYTAEPRNEK